MRTKLVERKLKVQRIAKILIKNKLKKAKVPQESILKKEEGKPIFKVK
jgi:hypothetical protein